VLLLRASMPKKLIENSTSGRRVAQGFAEEADAWSADLIMAGTRFRHGASRVFSGSAADDIARVANSLLLFIRTGSRAESNCNER
jgi:nucleotide-binding universal stress UspA family protein